MTHPPDYMGTDVGSYRNWHITFCSIRPSNMLYEAHPFDHDGTVASLFAPTRAKLKACIDEAIEESDE